MSLEKRLRRLLTGEHSHFHLTFNDEHACNYMSARDFEEAGGYEDDEWVSDAERLKALETNSVWTFHWYPRTPVGFCILRASSFEALLAAIDDVED